MKVMTIDSLDGVRAKRRRAFGDANEQVALALGEAEELYGKLVEAAESGRIDSETFTALQARFDLLRAQESSRARETAAAEAMLERVRAWKRDVRSALGLGTALIAFALVGTALAVGGGAVWWFRRKRKRS